MTLRGMFKQAKNILRKKETAVQDQRGVGMVETIIAVAILGTAVVAFVSALSAGSIAVRWGDEQAVANRLVRTQLEYTKSLPYDAGATTYTAVDTPEGYTISVQVSSIPGTDEDIQKVTVSVIREAEAILTIEDYKVNR